MIESLRTDVQINNLDAVPRNYWRYLRWVLFGGEEKGGSDEEKSQDKINKLRSWTRRLRAMSSRLFFRLYLDSYSRDTESKFTTSIHINSIPAPLKFLNIE